jgi:3-methyladenine DNA glycosylase/8-oxoguanine DNA glycosylase
LAHFGRVDPLLASAARSLEPFPEFPTPQKRRESHFESLARAIVFQQLAYKAASTIWGRVVALTPGPRPPKPAEFLSFPDEQLRGVGLSRNKMLAIQDLANRIESKQLRLAGIFRLDDDQVISQLTEVRGIGPWTAQMFLMFKLGRLDLMPSSDLGVQEGLRLLDGNAKRSTPLEVQARSEKWAPYRSAAAWYLWRLADQAKE